MRSFKFAFIAVLAMASISASVGAKQPSCAGFIEGRSSPLDVDQFYARRAVDIMRAARKGDANTLGKLVGSQATFSFWRGDNGFGSRQSGIPGALELARVLKPSRFQVMSDFPGPISVTPLKCEWTTTVLFRTEVVDEGATMKFKFVDGLLVEAHGNAVVISEGDLR